MLKAKTPQDKLVIFLLFFKKYDLTCHANRPKGINLYDIANLMFVKGVCNILKCRPLISKYKVLKVNNLNHTTTIPIGL